MLDKDGLFSYYENNPILIRQHNFTLQDLERMIPFEREMYIASINREMDKD